MTMIVRRPSPFGELMSLRSAMDRLFEDSFVRPLHWSASGDLALPLDVTATADEVTVQGSLPGYKPEDVEITIEGGALTISGQTHDERQVEEGSYLLQEIRRGSFSRTIVLPEGVEPDRATATFENGLLTLRIPKAEQVKPHRITITPTAEGVATPIAATADTTGSAEGA